MQAQITVNQEFVQTQTPSKMVNTVNVGDTNAEIMKENEQLDAFANIPSLPFSNLNVMNDVALCALPEVAMLSKNESILANMNTKMANSTCREVANDATLSERLLAFADCKTRALIKKVDTNIVNEYKQLRGY
jgi:hypothetical protein